MKLPFTVFYTPAFPIDRITDRGESGWHAQPNHTRNRYDFCGAVLEHIDNTFCEPIQITVHGEKDVAAGPSGVVRLYALYHRRGWTHIPAIVSTRIPLPWLPDAVPVTTREQFRAYYRLEPADIGFHTDGRAYHRNHNPNPEQLLETFVVAPETKERMLAMLTEEQD